MDIDKVAIRRNVLLSGSALIIVALGKGQFRTFFMVELSNPEVALYALLLFFVISVWRYMLATRSATSSFSFFVLGRLINQRGFRKVAKEAAENLIPFTAGDREKFAKAANEDDLIFRGSLSKEAATGIVLFEVSLSRGTSQSSTHVAQLRFRQIDLAGHIGFGRLVHLRALHIKVLVQAILDDMTFFNLFAPHLIVVAVFFALFPTLVMAL